LGHRHSRDQRITTHVALSARAFGANKFVYSGGKDTNLEESLRDVVKRWGGDFEIEFTDKVPSLLRSWDGIIIHLTMYGESHKETLKTLELYKDEDLLIVVGGAKVPRYVYAHADFNTAVGWQPHSEIAALTTLLYELNDDDYLYKKYGDSQISLNADSLKAQRSERFQN
jgi:tRNA (cytidine56-2'-O)-methyltransferase